MSEAREHGSLAMADINALCEDGSIASVRSCKRRRRYVLSRKAKAKNPLDEEYQPSAFSPDCQSCSRAGCRDNQSRVSCRHTQGHHTYKWWGKSPKNSRMKNSWS